MVCGATAALPTAMNWTSVAVHTSKESKTLLPNFIASRYFEFCQKKLLVKILERKLIDMKRKKKNHLLKKEKKKNKKRIP